MPKVKCIYCGERLERDSDACVKIRDRRYAHKTCEQAISAEERQKEEDKSKLYKYISKLYGENANWNTIRIQIERYEKEQGYTYSGMLKSLMYFYEVQKGDKSKGHNNLGIIPHVYRDAYNYYYELWLRQEQNREAEKVAIRQVEITIHPPSAKRKIKLFDLGED